MNSIWKIKPLDTALAKCISEALDIHELTANLLVNRGITNIEQAKDFLNPNLNSIHDPFLLKDMKKAVLRIKEAVQKKEKVMVFGDYDVDGISACALMVRVLRSLNLETFYYLPHRLNEGYGLSKAGVTFAKKNNANLVITVDCGISSKKEVGLFKQKGIDVVVTDHHEPLKDELPLEAIALINPKQVDCRYPDKDICGVGVASKLAHALLGKVPSEHFDLLCLGTLSDVVPLFGENRVFVKYGLEALNQTKKIGLQALFEAARIQDKEITPFFVGFIIGPRINAAGRLSSAEEALKLFLTEDATEATSLANSLEEQNRKRQSIEEKILNEAIEIVESEFNFAKDFVIVLARKDWHRGVIGIVASRIADKYYRPTIVMSKEGGLAHASARSIKSFHLFEAISHCKELLEDFGGHKYAAGLSLKKENIEKFKKKINDYARRQIKNEDLLPSLEAEAEVLISMFDKELIHEISALSPFGEGNPEPVFCSRGVGVKEGAQVLGRGALRFWITDGFLTAKAIGFKKADLLPLVSNSSKIDMVYSPSIDTWQGADQVQFKIKDLKPNS